MAKVSLIKRMTQSERINFLLTNRIPRRYATLLMGWFSKIEIRFVTKLSLFIWKRFADELNLDESERSDFKSLHECFIRRLKPGMRDIDMHANIVTSPCDAIIGAHGTINDTQLFQTKGFPYTLMDLLADETLVERYRNGIFVTLRLKSTMYHRFHAPYNCHVSQINYISGDTWNVNPVSLKRIQKLYCKNERAVIDLQLDDSAMQVTLVPVAAILVAGIKLHCLPDVLDLRYQGPNQLQCDAAYNKGDEMGYFQHGSTIIVFANQSLRIHDDIHEGMMVKMGQPLLHRK